MSSKVRGRSHGSGADEVLAGRLSPREVVGSTLYAEALINASGEFTAWQESASEEDSFEDRTYLLRRED